ncbi:hypothetical protein ACLMJK_002287 [Lecanora helva]
MALAIDMRPLIAALSWLLMACLTQAASLSTQPQTNATLPSSLNSTSASGVGLISFRDTVYRATMHTLALYPQAQLYEIEAVSVSGATTDPHLLKEARLIFAIPNHAPSTTLIVDMSDHWGRWKDPRLSPLPVPPREKVMSGLLGMDLDEANTYKEGAGFGGPYWSVIVAWPVGLPAGRDQPMYMFQMEDDTGGKPSVIYVGTRDGSVFALYDAKQMDSPEGGRLVSTS